MLAGILPSVSALLFSLLPSLCWWCKHQILKKDETKLKQIFKAHKGGAGHTVDFWHVLRGYEKEACKQMDFQYFSGDLCPLSIKDPYPILMETIGYMCI